MTSRSDDPKRPPMQPMERDEHGVTRFRRNAIVRDLLDAATAAGLMDLNAIARNRGYTDEDRMQLAQLIGYSLSGYAELDYVSDESYARAAGRARKLPRVLGVSTYPTFPPCVDCGEPDAGSCPEGRCRECDMDHIVAAGSCRACLRWIMREDWFGPARDQHAAGCTLASVEDCGPRDAAELSDVRARRGCGA